MSSNYLELEPARAKAKSADALWDNPEWVLEEKWNGWRFLMHFGRDLDRTYLTGRRVSKETGLLSEKGLLAPALHVISFNTYVLSSPTGARPDVGYTVFDGEVMPPIGAGFRDMASIMNADVDTSRATIERLGPPTYRVFDILYADGVDVREQPMIERRRILRSVMRGIRNPLIQLTPQMASSQATYDTMVDAGGEGVILKNICGAYGESGSWVKVKKYSTIDVIVTGFTDAKFGRTGKFEGQIGAARVSVVGQSGDLVEIGRVSGMTDDIRLDMSQHPERWLGTVIEVRAQEFAKDRLAHPRFKRARPDADPNHATWAKMVEDLNQTVAEKRDARVVSGVQQCLPL